MKAISSDCSRRAFLRSTIAASAAAACGGSIAGAALPDRVGLGYNTYSLRALKLNDRQFLDRAAAWKLDALFLQATFDPGAEDPAHWAEVKAWSEDLGLRLETGGGVILPATPEKFDASVATLRKDIVRARAMGSPIVRAICSSFRDTLPLPTAEQNIALAVRVLRAVRSQVVDAGLKIAIEVHKDFQAWEHKILIEEAGKEFVGTYLDTGNPVFVMEDPLLTLETLAPYTVSLHLRDSIVYEHPEGIAVQWVPLGEGTIDFRQFLAAARRLLDPDVHAYIKPITGRPVTILPVYDEAFWKRWYPAARVSEFSRFLKIAKSGRPYERAVVSEDVAGTKIPEPYQAALAHQQVEHLERSIKYAREVLKLGRR
jgi:sugar phosphate isomerase/epimerase